MFSNLLRNISPVVKNLLLINVLFYIAQWTFPSLMQNLELYPFISENFKPWQLATHFFMHSPFSIGHIFFNMFALWMFGNQLENVWGSKRFLTYFLITGMGAAALHIGVNQLQISFLEAKMSAEQINLVLTDGYSALKNGMNFTDVNMRELNALYHIPTVGASGAVFGVLLAFGMLFPNTLIYIYFALPIKAKYFVMFYGAVELWSGIQNNPGDNVAHFAHLGGMIFGYFLIKYWRKNSQHFY